MKQPTPTEMEAAYTARVIQPIVAAAIGRLKSRHGLVQGGDGAGPPSPVPLAGSLFYPDVTVAYHSQPMIAIEVKLVRPGAGVQKVLATGLGQAVIYQGRYAHSLLLIVGASDYTGPWVASQEVAAINDRTEVSVVQVVARP